MTPSRSKTRNQKGYLLLSVMLLVTIMLLMLSIEAPRMAQQIKREKENELIHRGKEYAKAVRKFVRKTGNYPTSLEQLEDTNHMRFLRKRYEDPMTGKADWKLIHQGEAQVKIPQNQNNSSLQGTSNPTLTGSSNASPSPTPQAFNGGGALSGSGGLGGDQSAGGQGGTSLSTSNVGNGQQFGGGGIIGVASTSKESGIHEFNGDNEYDKWLFVYDAKLEQAAATMGGSADGGIAVGSPRAGSENGGATPTGSPAPSGSPAPGITPNPNPNTTPAPPL